MPPLVLARMSAARLRTSAGEEVLDAGLIEKLWEERTGWVRGSGRRKSRADGTARALSSRRGLGDAARASGVRSAARGASAGVKSRSSYTTSRRSRGGSGSFASGGAFAEGEGEGRPRGTHLRVIAQRQDLAEKGDGLLPDALRVADVAHDHLVERILGRVRREVSLDLTSPGHDSASTAYCIDLRSQRVYGYARHGAMLGFQVLDTVDARTAYENAGGGSDVTRGTRKGGQLALAGVSGARAWISGAPRRKAPTENR